LKQRIQASGEKSKRKYACLQQSSAFFILSLSHEPSAGYTAMYATAMEENTKIFIE
jgi:hypothetical protein